MFIHMTRNCKLQQDAEALLLGLDSVVIAGRGIILLVLLLLHPEKMVLSPPLKIPQKDQVLSSMKFDPTADLMDLKGKVAIVTGGNTGIGYWTVHRLACCGAKVYLTATNEACATEAIERLKGEGLGPGNGEILWLKLELSDIPGTKAAAEEFLGVEDRLDILVNNAGWTAGSRGPSEEYIHGVVTRVVINYISPFLFTRTLLPLLQETARETGSDVRIVNLSSVVHTYIPSTVRIKDVGDLNNTFKGYINNTEIMQYAFTKLMIVFWTRSLQQQFDAAEPPVPITTMAVHPGIVNTSWPEQMPWVVRWLVRVLILDPKRGSDNPVFAASSKKVADNKDMYKGAYLQAHPVGQIGKLGKDVMDDERAKELWETTENFLGSHGVDL